MIKSALSIFEIDDKMVCFIKEISTPQQQVKVAYLVHQVIQEAASKSTVKSFEIVQLQWQNEVIFCLQQK